LTFERFDIRAFWHSSVLTFERFDIRAFWHSLVAPNYWQAKTTGLGVAGIILFEVTLAEVYTVWTLWYIPRITHSLYNSARKFQSEWSLVSLVSANICFEPEWKKKQSFDLNPPIPTPFREMLSSLSVHTTQDDTECTTTDDMKRTFLLLMTQSSR
jgi:hypothetical protein